MSAQAFTNPDFGKQVRIEQYGREVHLIFVAETDAKADQLIENLLTQLKAGALNLTMMGRPTSVTEPFLDDGRDVMDIGMSIQACPMPASTREISRQGE